MRNYWFLQNGVTELLGSDSDSGEELTAVEKHLEGRRKRVKPEKELHQNTGGHIRSLVRREKNKRE